MIAMHGRHPGVLMCMLLTYGRFGVYACVALIINVLMILG